ncbi:MAG: hypothetical protein V4539_13755 [Bacteroidota bacterium]
MRKCLFGSLLALFSALFADKGFAQQVDSMMSVYADRSAPEKIHIHFDKTIYNKGETVWYKIYILQGRDTTAASMNVYLEWYDADGKMIRQTVAPILLSTAQGSFDIPADYKGESLHVRAYTRWMLNDDPAFSYHRELAVYSNTTKPTRAAPKKTIVETFPEGGFLIQGLHTRVAFKATNQYGNPVFIKGVLMDDKNNTLDSLNVEHDGMGSFYFAPLAGQTYKLNWTDEYGVTGSTPVPVTKTKGARITIETTTARAKFQVERTDSVPENFKKMILLVHMNQVGLYQVAINTAEKTKLSSEIPINELPTGLLQFTLFTSDWIPIAERVIFINNRLHEFDVKLTAPLINVEKRGKNAFEIFVPDTVFTNMSMSITDAVVSPFDQYSIFSDVLLSSEIKGKVYNPGYYLSSNSDSVAAHLDLVMLTNAWRRFDWDKIKASIPPKINYTAETGYMKMTGKVLGMKKNGPPVAINMIVVLKDSSKQFISVPVAKDGSFEQPMVFFDTANVYYNFNNNASLTEKAELELSNGLLKLSPKNIQPGNGPPFLGNDSIAKQKLNALLAEQELLKKKMAGATLQEVIVTTRVKTKEEILDEKYTRGFFSGAPTRGEYILDLSDPHKQTTASNILEYLQSKIPGLIVRGSTVEWRGDGPIMYLNEMRVDVSTILSVPIMNVAMIKAFPPLFMFAAGGGRGGAIAVYTRLGSDHVSPTETKGLSNMVLPGYANFKEFYSPSYEQPEEGYTKPDTRTTLYWNPYLITNKTQQHMRVEFFNNDFTKTFNVVLEGINAAGKMTRVVRTINANSKAD